MARPRNPDLDARILHATRELIDSHGAADLTIDAVAARVGVTRPTIYRRWATRAELLFAAQSNASVSVEFTDTGSLRGDLCAAVSHLANVMSGSDRSVAADQFGRMITDAAFAERVWSQRWSPDREAVHQLWVRAVQRHEVGPDTDGTAVIDDLVAICLFRIYLAHHTLDQADIETVVDRVLDGVLTRRGQP